MTFDEFMVATGNTLMLEGIREAYSEKRAYQLHDQAMGFYRTYLLVGGMPKPAEESRLVRTGQPPVRRKRLCPWDKSLQRTCPSCQLNPYTCLAGNIDASPSNM